MSDLILGVKEAADWIQNNHEIWLNWFKIVSIDSDYSSEGMEGIYSLFEPIDSASRVFNEHWESIAFFALTGTLLGKNNQRPNPTMGVIEQVNKMPDETVKVRFVAKKWFQLLPMRGAMVCFSEFKVEAKTVIIS